MVYNPNLPVDGSDAEASEMRAQFTGLKAIADNLQTQIKTIPAGPPPGPQGDPGRPMTFPVTGPAIIQGRVIADTGDLSIVQSDPNGSGETGLAHGADASIGAPLPVIAGRLMGNTVYNHRMDPAGLVDGAGTPSVQDGAFMRFDAATQTWKPFHGTTEDVQIKDSADNVFMINFVNGLYTGRTPVP